MGPKFRMGTYVREVFDEMWKENRGCFMNKALSVRTGRGWIACESFPHTSHVNLYGKWTNHLRRQRTDKVPYTQRSAGS